MKVSELRKQIITHSPEQLQVLVVELYKALSSSARKNTSLDALIKNPASGKAKKQKNIRRPIHEIDDDTHRFVENARMQYFLVPNRHISKKERSTWRFIVMKLYKELITEKADQEKAAELLETL